MRNEASNGASNIEARVRDTVERGGSAQKEVRQLSGLAEQAQLGQTRNKGW